MRCSLPLLCLAAVSRAIVTAESLDVDVDGYEYVTSLMDEDQSMTISSVATDAECTTSLDKTLSSEPTEEPEFVSENVDVEEQIISNQLNNNNNNNNDDIVIEEAIKYPYEENMVLRPLPNNHLLTSFVFDMVSESFIPGKDPLKSDQYSHYTVFPRAIKPLLERTSTRQLQLRFTRGHWDADSWEALPYNGFKSGGSGVELWATIEASSKEDAYEKWKSLANYLSGHFCASINFIDMAKTSFPINSFKSKGEIPVFDNDDDSKSKLYLLHAALANEPICTENLTPLIKLLPTRGKSGISSYLDGHKVFDSVWHSLSIDVDTKCNEQDGTCQYEMEAMVDMVVHVPNVLERFTSPIPKPASGEDLRCDMNKPYDAFECFPLPEATDIKFSLSDLFNKTISGVNKFSEVPSTVCAEVTGDWDTFLRIISKEDANDTNLVGTADNCFHLDDSKRYDVILSPRDSKSVVSMGNVPVFASRALTGYGQDHGGLRTVLRNPNDTPVTVAYYESLPWFIRIYLSTLKVETDNDDSKIDVDTLMESMYYSPAIDRERPSHLEFTLEIPAHTTVSFSYRFDKTLLQFAEYPPDANHGFEIESAVVTVLSPEPYQLRTSTLLLLLSTPDFSMPYNVIIITSTIIGLIFGVMFNLLVKRVVTLEEADKILMERSIKYRLLMLKQRILTKLGLN